MFKVCMITLLAIKVKLLTFALLLFDKVAEQMAKQSTVSRCKTLYNTLLQDAAVLTLDMAQRSDADLLAASLDQLVEADAGMADVQACMALDGNLRQRYAKVGPARHSESCASVQEFTDTFHFVHAFNHMHGTPIWLYMSALFD